MSASTQEHICVCICTFQRPVLLRRLLDALPKQRQGSFPFSVSCVVVDNDSAKSAEVVVREFVASNCFPVRYECEPDRNFASVRNRAVASSQGDYIAFVDDDEVPVDEWLQNLLQARHAYNADAVLGPVRPYFEEKAPAWLIRSGLCDRPILPTGKFLSWGQCRTGNVLLCRKLFSVEGIRFDPAFRTGGEDVDFFKRAAAAGFRFVWCEEAPAYELVPASRMRAAYHLRRALLQGGISLGYDLRNKSMLGRLKVGLKSALAIVIYSVLLPFICLTGLHRAMRLLVKGCHHLGRFSTLIGCPIMRERKL
jgi:succinoglycan biosynthesis protein ExoM